MKGTAAEEIVKARKKEKESKAATILLACLHRRKGRSGREIAEILQKPSSTVYGWLVCMHRGGLDARHDSPKSGRPRKIGRDRYDDIMKRIDAQPEANGIKSNVWTGRLILIMLAGLGIEISLSTACRTMRHMDATWRMRGRPTDSRAPTDEVKAKFKLNLAQTVLGYVAAGYSLFFIDEAHFSTKTHRGRTWMSKALSLKQVVKPFGRRCTCFGAFGPEGFFWQYSERANTQTIIEFVRRMFIRRGRILLVMDNASYHKSKALLRELARFGGGVQVVYLPPYSPDLNPVEMIWKELKKYIANGVYKRVNDMTGAMDGMIKGGTVLLPKVPKYLPRAAGRNGTVPGRRCGSLGRTTARSDPHPEATCLMEN